MQKCFDTPSDLEFHIANYYFYYLRGFFASSEYKDNQCFYVYLLE